MQSLVQAICFAAATTALLVAGCASSDLSQDAKLQGQIAEGLPVGTPSPEMMVRAIWYPKAEGAGSTELSPVRPIVGVLALAGDHLYFLEWNDTLLAYDTRIDIDVGSTIKVAAVQSGLSPMLVVESKNLSFDSFELMKAGQFAPDWDTTSELCKKLQDIRSRTPPVD